MEENNTLSEVVFPATDERGVATLRLLAAAREAADAIAATLLQPLLPFPLKTTKGKLQNPKPQNEVGSCVGEYDGSGTMRRATQRERERERKRVDIVRRQLRINPEPQRGCAGARVPDGARDLELFYRTPVFGVSI